MKTSVIFSPAPKDLSSAGTQNRISPLTTMLPNDIAIWEPTGIDSSSLRWRPDFETSRTDTGISSDLCSTHASASVGMHESRLSRCKNALPSDSTFTAECSEPELARWVHRPRLKIAVAADRISETICARKVPPLAIDQFPAKTPSELTRLKIGSPVVSTMIDNALKNKRQGTGIPVSKSLHRC